jgi:biotin transport system substrate-specific component
MNHHDMTRNMVLAALFAALTAIGAFLQIPTGTVPITLQFLFTALAGLLLGWKWGAISQLLYVGIGLLGLPVFTQGGGIGYVLLLGLIPAAAVIGALTARRTGYLTVLAAVLVGDLILYAVGVPYMYLILHVYMQSAKTFPALLAAMLVYVPGDTLKIVVVTALAPVLRRTLAKAVPNL